MTLPQVSDLETNIWAVTPLAAAASQPALVVRVVYDKPMNYDYNPTISFSPDLLNDGATPTLSLYGSWWVGPEAFDAWYTVSDSSEPLANVAVTVSGAKDVIGNVQVPYTSPKSPTPVFTVDMADPAPPLSTVASVVLTGTQSPGIITAADIGHEVTLEVTYTEPMDYRDAPYVGTGWTGRDDTTTPPTPSTLTRDLDNSYWVSNTVYRSQYLVSASNWFSVGGVSVSVLLGVDATGRDQVSWSNPDVFDVNTATTPPSVSALTLSTQSVTAGMAGTQEFVVTVDYNATMRQGATTVVSFEGTPGEDMTAVNNTLVLNTTLSGWTSDTEYVAYFDIYNVDAVVPDLWVDVAGSQDATGHVQYPYTTDSPNYHGGHFGIHMDPPPAPEVALTESPATPLAAPLATVQTTPLTDPFAASQVLSQVVPLAASQTFSPTAPPLVPPTSPENASPNVAQTVALADAVLSGGPINLSIGELDAPATKDHSPLGPADYALLYAGTWLEA